MPDTNDDVLLQWKMKPKPKFEDIVPDFLDGGIKKAALDFAVYLRANKMPLKWISANRWAASYKGKSICYITLNRGARDPEFLKGKSWVLEPRIQNYGEYEEQIRSDGLQNVILGGENFYYCRSCHPAPCNPRDIILLGKEVKGVCGGRCPVWFHDPGEAEIDCTKRLLEFMKQTIDGGMRKD